MFLVVVRMFWECWVCSFMILNFFGVSWFGLCSILFGVRILFRLWSRVFIMVWCSILVGRVWKLLNSDISMFRFIECLSR